MARDDDDILLGDPVAAARASHDSDGDGVSDLQERLEGTDPDDASDHLQRDPTIAPREDGDPRGDLDRASLERETVFDPIALIPEGMSVDTGLTGLKNLDGSDLPTGPDHDGLGEDALLEGRIGANSPLDMERDPLAANGGAPSGTQPSGGHGGAPPEDADLSFNAPNPDLYGGYANDVAHAAGTLARDAVNYVKDVAATPGRLYDNFVQSYTEPLETPEPPAADPPGPPPPPPPPAPWQDGGTKSTDPDADPAAGTATGEDVARLVAVGRGDTDFVEGYGGGPEIEDDAPPVRYGDLVTDPGEESGGTGATTTDALSGAPDAPVINTINPDSGIVRPPTGGSPPGGDGGDNTGLTGESNPATAVVADDPGAPGMTEVGSGGGSGIQSTVADSADDVLGTPPPVDIPADAPPPAEVADPGASAVDAFATKYLEDASLTAPDLVADGLSADLGADPAPVVDDVVIDDVALLDPDGADLLEGSIPEADDLDA